ncbi:MAG TPA: PA2778 family cysteine peptidase [Burkholderiaceae bacterium]|nr:PA2778 family cysteine peptidase [Burkholderiaceae bacterium]
MAAAWAGRARLMPALLLAALLLGGCATQTRALRAAPPPGAASRLELAATPFFAQERYQCGPAALAMALGAAGIAVAPDALVPQVYLAEREGSLQVEMLAAARRNGALGVTIAPRLEALLAELQAGHPVLVLQNLSLPIFPRWHYAVAIGYDLAQGDIVLHSGTTQHMVMSMSTFEHTWARSGYWGMVALAPGQLPASSSRETVLDALVAWEQSGKPDAVRQSYAAAERRWPGELGLLLGLGNTAYGAGDRAGAADAFRRATQAHPDSAPAFNNLAVVLSEQGDYAAARQAAGRALALGGPWRAEAQATLDTIDRAERQGRPAARRQ